MNQAGLWRTLSGSIALLLAVSMIVVGYVVPGKLRASHDLRILAGSELRDIIENQDFAEKLRRATGIRLVPTYTGTLQGVQEGLDSLQDPTAGDSFDLSWFSTPAYLQLVTSLPGSPRLPDQKFTPIMRSPVVLGVRQDVADRLQWRPGAPVSWQDVARAAGAGQLTFAATDAATSNSGFSALVSVAAAFDRSPGTPLYTEDIDTAAITQFFRGRTVKEESSGPLTEEFCKTQRADALISYESEILAATQRPDCGGPLRIVYPEGSMYASYPLVHLKDGVKKDAAYIRQWLLSAEGQDAVAATNRRPVRPETQRSAAIPNQDPSELSVPDIETVRTLINDYLDVVQRPSHTIYVLDYSYSMEGERINELRNAMCSLTGADPSVISQFTRFRANEEVTVLPFATQPQPSMDFRADGRPPNFSSACRFVQSRELGPGDKTAVFDAVQRAWNLLSDDATANEGYCNTVVLMTDGDSNNGLEIGGLGPPQARTFTIRFGSAPAGELQELAHSSGGRALDATQRSLRAVFEETRSLGC